MPSFGAPALLGYLEEDGCDGPSRQTSQQSMSYVDIDSR